MEKNLRRGQQREGKIEKPWREGLELKEGLKERLGDFFDRIRGR